MGTEALVEAIDGLLAGDATSISDADSIRCLVRELTRLEAAVTKAVAAFDRSGDWANDGAKTTAAWIATSCRIPRAMAARMVRRGRHTRHLPLITGAWEQGDITSAHFDVVAAVRTDETEELLARDEGVLLAQARRLRFEPFTRAVAYWGQLADPDGSEEAAEARRSRRDVYLAPSVSGMYLGQMTLDPISGSIVAGELDRIEQEFFKADWARAREDLGREPTVGDLWRTSAQRRADAMVEIAARSAVARPEGRRPAPLFSVLVDWPTLSGRVCELAEGIVVSPGDLVDWLSVADLERAVMTAPGRVEVSPTQRLFTGATRRALELRDRQCAHPFCDVEGHRCQADHIVPWASGGKTTQENGRLLCGFHNRLRNQRPPPDG